MQDMFTMIMLVDFESDDVTLKHVVDKLESAEKELGLSIHVQREEIFTSMHRI
jgi:ACT domain-containing protein